MKNKLMSKTIIGILIVLAIAIVTFFLFYTPQTSLGVNYQQQCVGNLKSIGKALAEYQDNHNGAFPDTLSSLDEYISEESFDCPLKKIKNIKSYIYVVPKENLGPDQVIIRCENHREGERIIQLHRDGHCSINEIKE